MSDAAQLTGFPVTGSPGEAEDLYRRCQAEAFGFTCCEFGKILADVLERSFPGGCSDQERRQFLSSLRLDDLVLARACARGVESAWDRFLMLYREKLFATAAVIAREDSAARELADSLYADLFGTRVQEDGTRISKLDSYTGRGSLEGWLKAVLAQQYVNRYRSQRKLVSFDEAIETASPNSSSTSYLTSEQTILSEVTDAALGALSSEERFLLAAYYLDSRSLAEIGRMLCVHESTISRRLEKITSRLRKRIVKDLCRRGFSKQAAAEMLAVDVRDVTINLRDRLTHGTRGGPFYP